MKKRIALFLSLAMVLAIVPIYVFAEPDLDQARDLHYELRNDTQVMALDADNGAYSTTTPPVITPTPTPTPAPTPTPDPMRPETFFPPPNYVPHGAQPNWEAFAGAIVGNNDGTPPTALTEMTNSISMLENEQMRDFLYTFFTGW